MRVLINQWHLSSRPLSQPSKAYWLRDAPKDFNIQQLYALPTLYLCVLYLSQNKQRLVPLTPYTDWFL